VAFIVRDETGEIVGHADIFAVTGDGTREIGQRDPSGVLSARVPRELAEKGKGGVLVCAEGYYCGGWLAGEPELAQLRGEERILLAITLAAVRLP
jgi:hypothetical protein